VLKGFARRYFILQQSGLLSYSFEPGKPSRDEIFLPRAAISTTPGHKDIHIDSDAATFHIKCLTTDDFNKWMTAFRSFSSFIVIEFPLIMGSTGALLSQTPREHQLSGHRDLQVGASISSELF